MAAVVRTFEEAGQRLVLRDLGTHHELLLGQVPILSSAALATERAFGELARDLVGPSLHRVLIGGLGFGATLGGVLAVSGPETEVVVVEKLATVVELLRTDLASLIRCDGGLHAGVTPSAVASLPVEPHAPPPKPPSLLDDPRVRLVQEDVADVIARERGLDAILLDVDNGPGWASFRTNARLYAPDGLQKAREALRSGGALAVWSGYPADTFTGQLRRAGFTPSVVPMRERGVVRARAYVGRAP